MQRYEPAALATTVGAVPGAADRSAGMRITVRVPTAVSPLE
jgi:hypothetical protein